jgi:hypothetical protein
MPAPQADPSGRPPSRSWPTNTYVSAAEETAILSGVNSSNEGPQTSCFSVAIAFTIASHVVHYDTAQSHKTEPNLRRGSPQFPSGGCPGLHFAYMPRRDVLPLTSRGFVRRWASMAASRERTALWCEWAWPSGQPILQAATSTALSASSLLQRAPARNERRH